MLALPAVIGVFWGAPLVARELETGTHRLVWCQSVTRTRWLASKVGLIGLAAVLATGALSLALTWWSGPIDAAIAAGQEADGAVGTSRMIPAMFAARGIAPIGYAAFAFTLGIASGLLIRRTVPAMAVTLAVFLVVQIAVPPLVRSHLSPASVRAVITNDTITGLHARVGRNGPVGPIGLQVDIKKPGAWILSNKTVGPTGHVVDTLPSWMADCFPPPPGAPQTGPRVEMPACFARLTKLGYRQLVTYQPNSRYWTLQAVETAIFLALAGALAGFSLWRLRRLS
jgi:hypothetical protein